MLVLVLVLVLVVVLVVVLVLVVVNMWRTSAASAAIASIDIDTLAGLSQAEDSPTAEDVEAAKVAKWARTYEPLVDSRLCIRAFRRIACINDPILCYGSCVPGTCPYDRLRCVFFGRLDSTWAAANLYTYMTDRRIVGRQINHDRERVCQLQHKVVSIQSSVCLTFNTHESMCMECSKVIEDLSQEYYAIIYAYDTLPWCRNCRGNIHNTCFHPERCSIAEFVELPNDLPITASLCRSCNVNQVHC